jgi:hypothetical protein
MVELEVLAVVVMLGALAIADLMRRLYPLG